MRKTAEATGKVETMTGTKLENCKDTKAYYLLLPTSTSDLGIELVL